jgi:carbon monoxide dehydrogenase subunit G
MLVGKTAMPSISHAFDAKCAPAALWAVLSDLASVVHTNPLVSSVEVVGEQLGGLGAVRCCRLRPRGTVTERVCAYEHGRAIGFEVVQSDWPIISMTWRTEVTPQDRGAHLSQVLDYRMKFGPLGRLLNALVMQRAIERNVGEALKGVVRLAEGRA